MLINTTVLLPGANGQRLFGGGINGTLGGLESVLPASKAEVRMRKAHLQTEIAGLQSKNANLTAKIVTLTAKNTAEQELIDAVINQVNKLTPVRSSSAMPYAE